MKKIVLVIAFVVVTVSATFAQNFAYVNSEYILKHIPEYTSAQKQLDDLSQKWQQDVDQQYAEIEKLYKAYQNDQVLLNEDMRRRREDEIVKKKKMLKIIKSKNLVLKVSYLSNVKNWFNPYNNVSLKQFKI